MSRNVGNVAWPLPTNEFEDGNNDQDDDDDDDDDDHYKRLDHEIIISLF